MGVVTKYVCDKCGKETEDLKKTANVNFNSVFGTVKIKKLLCRNCWKKFVDIVHRFFEKK